jgi:hypothetical protein
MAQVKNVWKLLIDRLRSCRRVRIIHWFMPHNLAENLEVHQASTKCVPRLMIPSTEKMMREIFWKMTLPVMRHGFTVVILKPNSPHAGRVLLHLTTGTLVRAVLLVTWYHQGTVRYEFALEGQTINQYFYLAVLRHLWDVVWRKRTETWTAGSWLLHHDNVPAHRVLPITQFLAEHSIPTLQHPPYSPDLFPLYFLLFRKLKIIFNFASCLQLCNICEPRSKVQVAHKYR